MENINKTIKIFFLTILLVSCSDKKIKSEKMEITKNKNNYTLIYDFPFNGEIMVNDVVIDKSLYGVLSGTELINYFILDNGKQSIKAEIFHPQYDKGGVISNDVLKKSTDEFALYNTIMDNGEVKNIQLINKLKFPEINSPVPFTKSEWNFNAELPFKLEGWKNSEDLSKWDKKELEKSVVAKYTELRQILNSGNGNEFVRQLEFSNKEFFIANYYNEGRKQEYLNNLKDDFSQQTNNVPLIENYNMRIMGNGKIVTLETLGRYKGQGILTTEDALNKKLYVIYVMLHKPKNSNDFQIVRMISYKTTLVK